MDDRRQHSRHTAELHLEVYDLHSDRHLGRVVDLSAEGFMVFGDCPQEADALVECRLMSYPPVEGLTEVRLGADCLWSRPGADGQHCWSGFHIIDLAEDQAVLLEGLLKRLQPANPGP